ncbi:recombinase family protein [Bradyrhizobium sp. RT10b]|uniref:recombinase family protein n=1 Tax=Bradyrhizobium sp. RT10b TaxID=3156331 RepID=UPI003396F177
MFSPIARPITGQTPENQVQEIAAAGFQVLHPRLAETISGSIAANERAGFKQFTNKLETSDVPIVTKLDRLDRNAIDVLQTVKALAPRILPSCPTLLRFHAQSKLPASICSFSP